MRSPNRPHRILRQRAARRRRCSVPSPPSHRAGCPARAHQAWRCAAPRARANGYGRHEPAGWHPRVRREPVCPPTSDPARGDECSPAAAAGGSAARHPPDPASDAGPRSTPRLQARQGSAVPVAPSETAAGDPAPSCLLHPVRCARPHPGDSAATRADRHGQNPRAHARVQSARPSTPCRGRAHRTAPVPAWRMRAGCPVRPAADARRQTHGSARVRPACPAAPAPARASVRHGAHRAWPERCATAARAALPRVRPMPCRRARRWRHRSCLPPTPPASRVGRPGTG